MERLTRQGLSVRAVFERVDRPLSPHEVRLEAQKEGNALGIATVHRHLRDLLASNSLSAVELPGSEAVHYERQGKAPHAHFLCRQCERVFDLEPLPLPRAPQGFALEGFETLLRGTCPDCTHGVHA